MSSSTQASRFSKIKPAVWPILACLLALIPLFILIRILATTGIDTVSNDYLRFVRLADRVLSPGYNWSSYFKDSFDNNVHSYAFLFLFRLGLAELTHLSVMAESYLGLALSAIKVLLLYLLFTGYVPIRSKLRFILIPALSILVYSLSQFSAYSFGETALQMGWTQVGILTGLWLLLLHGRHPLTPWVAAASGILASFSGGSGILAWPVFFLAILFTDPKNMRKYLAWLVGLGLGLWPYLAFSSYSTTGGLQGVLQYLTPRRFLTGLGLPMANNINYAVSEHSEAIRSGGLGALFVLLTGAIFIPFHSLTRFKRAVPGLLLIAWGLLASLQITASRTYYAPWYTASLMLFWIGLLALSVAMLPFETEVSLGKFLGRYRNWTWRTIGLGGLLLIAVLFIETNHSYEDKSFYLTSRSPASAACLRDYQTAPTYCEGLVFQWGVGNPTYLPEMGAIVDKYRWSVQAPHQEWTLQGDYALGKVILPIPGDTPSSQWVQENSDEPAVWSDYHHLNLLLSPAGTVLWQVKLPSNLKSAGFEMGISLVDYTQCTSALFSLRLSEVNGANTQVIRQNDFCKGLLTLTRDLLPYAGKSLLLQFTNESTSNQIVRIQFPRIDLDLDYSSTAVFTSPSIQPANTDLSPVFLSFSQSAAHFLPPPASGWQAHDLSESGNPGVWIKSGANPALTYTISHPLCVSDWSDYFLRIAVSDKFIKKYVHLTFQFQVSKDSVDSRSFYLPLLAGEDPHTYSLKLDLLNLPASACFTSIEITPNPVAAQGSDLWIWAGDSGFLPRLLVQ